MSRVSFYKCARLFSHMKRTFIFCVVALALVASVKADVAVSIHPGSTGSGQQVSAGCSYVLFDLVGFSGTIGNATFSSVTKQIAIPAYSNGMGQRLSAIPYSVTGGTLNIVEER